MAFWGTALNSGVSGLIEGVNAGIQQQGALRQMRRQDEHDQLAQQRYADELSLRQGQQELQRGGLALQQKQQEAIAANQTRDDEYRRLMLKLHEGQLGLQSRDQDIQDFKFTQAKQDAERSNAINWTKQAVSTLANGGQVDPDEFERNYTKASGGFSPRQLFSPEMAQHEATLSDWQAGKIRDYNDPRVKSAVKFMFPDITKRGLGEWTTQDIDGQKVTGKIVEKDIDQIGLIPQGKEGAGNLVASMRVKIADDKGNMHEYKAPLTQYGTSHPDDGVMLVSPVELNNRAMKIAQLRQLAQNNPAMTSMFAGPAINPKDQSIINKNEAAADLYRAKAAGVEAGGTGKSGSSAGKSGSSAGKVQAFDTKKADEYLGGLFGTQPSAESWMNARFEKGWESVGGDPMQSAKTQALKDAALMHSLNQDIGMTSDQAAAAVANGKYISMRRPGDNALIEGYIVQSRDDPYGKLIPISIKVPDENQGKAGALSKPNEQGKQTPNGPLQNQQDSRAPQRGENGVLETARGALTDAMESSTNQAAERTPEARAARLRALTDPLSSFASSVNQGAEKRRALGSNYAR